jgi:hypothetical protein
MRNLPKILTLLIILVFISCIKPVKIIIPENMQNIPAMPVVGAENSWRLDFGGFHAYNIKDSDSRVLLTDARNASYDIQSFDFVMNTSGGTQYECYCEFPMKSLDDETFRCVYQNVYNQFDTGQLTDRVISSSSGDIVIEEYYEYVGKKPGSKNLLVGYIFKDLDKYVGLVDVSKINDETVWIDPALDLHKQIMVAASATSFILKHRKWYEGFYSKVDEDTEYTY